MSGPALGGGAGEAAAGVALRRLAATLDARVRRELQVAMLTDVLGACAAARGLVGVLVVTADAEAGARADRPGARGSSPTTTRRGG